MAKVYLDYNVWDKISKDEDTKAFFTEMKEKGWSYYLSVAHYEELFHAQNNETPEYIGSAEKLNEVMNSFAEQGLLKPSIDNGVAYFPNNCARNVAKKNIEVNHDTQETMAQLETKKTNMLLNQGGKSISGIPGVNGNDLYKEIWNQQFVIDKIDEYNKKAAHYSTVPKEQSISFMGKEWKIQYGSENGAQELAYRYVQGMSQEIKRNSYIDIHSDYFRLEYVIERLCNILLLSGHKRDSTQRTYVSGAYDTQHIIMSTYCDIFITMDKKLAEKYKAIAYYLGIPIQVQRWDINQHKIV